jgi:hypothetical protein
VENHSLLFFVFTCLKCRIRQIIFQNFLEEIQTWSQYFLVLLFFVAWGLAYLCVGHFLTNFSKFSLRNADCFQIFLHNFHIILWIQIFKNSGDIGFRSVFPLESFGKWFAEFCILSPIWSIFKIGFKKVFVKKKSIVFNWPPLKILNHNFHCKFCFQIWYHFQIYLCFNNSGKSFITGLCDSLHVFWAIWTYMDMIVCHFLFSPKLFV